MEHWKITRDRSRCTRPGCPLPTAQHWMAVLDLPECLRRDVCDACFGEERKGDARDPVYWRCQRKAKGKKEPTLDLGTLAMLFDRLGEVVGDGPVGAEDGADSPDAPSGESGEAAGRDGSAGDSEEPAPLGRSRAASLRYFVALLLLRKRRLRALPARTEAQAAADLVVKDPKKPDQKPILLFAPELDEDDLGTLKDELLSLVDPGYEPKDDVSKAS